ncbi:uncharacterized protein MELLADRAFT_69890 [Melampsora larici-populina 98AG31]|uniref:RRM domain-containing protein n=1 Tax=Melampsora larici-populina (strain 98AG31 / pathotype 3-4-7) TaxID=747676 RepID=F4SCN4_MELLP|nr:uncharacterized protein MELLADRAFT_69890 [Melampsora larici-populina 98AG31]EGF97595.1 hypothetical protein MELLADRAFT_69890 [Melampsora larici-populina 98AG31]
MFEKILQHLVQFSDDLQNESRPTIDCGVLTQLQRIHVSRANEPKYSSDWDPSLPLPYPSSPHDSFDPLLFSRDGTQFTLCQQTVDAQMQEITTCRPVQMTGSDHPAVSYIGSGLLSATRNASGSCSSTDKSLSGSVGSPPFTTNRRGPGFGSQAASAWKAQQIAQEEAAEEAQKRMADKLVDESIIPSQDPSSRPKSTNVFVANFPAHWGKSDLWDLFEGIAIASVNLPFILFVHVITDSGMGGDANASGGTGFINVIRREDAEALLGLLDKKIWLIEGSALKFRAANSSAPTEMIHSHPAHRNRTIRRHPHKVLDRLRSEQFPGTDRHPRPTPATVLPLATMSTNIPAPRSLRLAGFLEVGGAQVGYIPQASGVASCYVTPYTVFPRLQPINAPGYLRTSGYRGNEENYPEFSWMPN